MQLYRELVRPHDGKIYCEIILRCREEHVFTKSIIVSSGRNIEIFGSAAQGYISSSHGTLVDDFEGTTVYGHVLDLRSGKVSELELRVRKLFVSAGRLSRPERKVCPWEHRYPKVLSFDGLHFAYIKSILSYRAKDLKWNLLGQ